MQKETFSVIGLGYVGLPVAVAFGQKHSVIGFDINEKRISQLKKFEDRTKEVSSEELKISKIQYTSNKEDLKAATFHIIAVPTPIDKHNNPDLTPMFKASESVGSILKKGDIVVYESTVYPGVCEEECLPILEKKSGLKGGVDFKIGYSPERINPGDKEHTFTKILKIVSAQDAESLDRVAQAYASVVTAGVYKASSIKVAEAAKVIENTQRDVNIALVNELSLIFDKMGIDTNAVIDAASTKWNFIKFRPGLVGGHCIGVDPYYLTFKAQELGYHPQVILSGRRINDGMGKYIAEKCVKEIIHAGHAVKGSVVTVLGLTFKEDCPDTRNSKVFDIIRELKDYGIDVQAFDPVADPDEIIHEMNIETTPFERLKKSHAIIAAVKHKEFYELGPKIFNNLVEPQSVLIDVKGMFNKKSILDMGIRYWSL
ncbi:MAG: nucleotide sugar dehydrogenase [Pseudobdellovibrionaceae bacterium]